MTIVLRRSRARQMMRSEEGFSLIEAVVSLFIAALVFGALASSTIAALRASMTSRQDQQAVDFMTRELEQLRNKRFGGLGHLDSDLSPASDSRITNCPTSGRCIDPGTGTVEKLHVLPAGSVIPSHLTTLVSSVANNNVTNKTDYRLGRYVTQVAGYSPTQLLRVTVFVNYTSGQTARSKSISSLITLAQRGLPLPVFKLTTTTSTSMTVNPGGTLTYGFKLVNQGAPDRWNLSLTGSGAAWPWELYRDNDSDGVYDVAGDTLLIDTDGNGAVDTDRIDPTGSVSFVLVFKTTTSTSGSNVTTTLTATSSAQPTVIGAIQSSTVTSSVQAGAVTSSTTSSSSTTSQTTPATDCNTAQPPVMSPVNGFTDRVYSLHNFAGPPGADTSAAALLSMSNDNATYGAALHAYSSNHSPYAGRFLAPVSASTTDNQALAFTDTRQYVDWRFEVGAKGTVSVPGVLKVWIGGHGASLSGASLRAIVYQGKTNAVPVVASGTASVTQTCPGFALAYIPISGTASSNFNNNENFGVRLISTGASNLQVAYDTAVYPASFTVGIK